VRCCRPLAERRQEALSSPPRAEWSHYPSRATARSSRSWLRPLAQTSFALLLLRLSRTRRSRSKECQRLTTSSFPDLAGTRRRGGAARSRGRRADPSPRSLIALDHLALAQRRPGRWSLSFRRGRVPRGSAHGPRRGAGTYLRRQGERAGCRRPARSGWGPVYQPVGVQNSVTSSASGDLQRDRVNDPHGLGLGARLG
jgi:hypothetical protein